MTNLIMKENSTGSDVIIEPGNIIRIVTNTDIVYKVTDLEDDPVPVIVDQDNEIGSSI